jgi:hypothetical protein
MISKSLAAPSAALAIALLLTGGLSGCAGGFGEAKEKIDTALENGAGGLDADIDEQGNAAVPADWPASVPVPPGDAYQSTTFGSQMTINTYTDADAATAHVDELTAAGFELLEKNEVDDGTEWKFTNGSIDVTYSVVDAGYGDGSAEAAMSVLVKD